MTYKNKKKTLDWFIKDMWNISLLADTLCNVRRQDIKSIQYDLPVSRNYSIYLNASTLVSFSKRISLIKQLPNNNIKKVSER